MYLQDPQAFIDDMASIFDGLDLTDIAAHTSEIMQSMMEKIRNHQVPRSWQTTSAIIAEFLIQKRHHMIFHSVLDMQTGQLVFERTQVGVVLSKYVARELEQMTSLELCAGKFEGCGQYCGCYHPCAGGLVHKAQPEYQDLRCPQAHAATAVCRAFVHVS